MIPVKNATQKNAKGANTMILIKASYKIPRKDDPTGEKAVKIASTFKRSGTKVTLERQKTFYRVTILDVCDINSTMEVMGKH